MGIKWQDITKFAAGGSLSLFVVLALIFNLSGMIYTHDGDKFCLTDCYSEIRVNSSYWNIKVEHAGDKDIIFKKMTRSRTLWLNLDKIDEFIKTDPYTKTELLVGTTSKYSTVKHEDYGYLRPIKDGDFLIKRTTKSNPYSSRIIIYGNKSPEKNVKWSFVLDDILIEKIDIDPVWEGLNKDTVFTKLISNKADISRGEAIFEIYNPVSDLSKESLEFSFNKAGGSDIDNYEVYINYSESYEVPIYDIITEIKSCVVYNNQTKQDEIIDCSENKNYITGYKTEYKEEWKILDSIPSGASEIKLIGYWRVHLGPQAIDWKPQIKFSKEILGIENDIILEKSEWAWWDGTWEKCKNLNVTGGSSSLIDFPFYINVSYDSDMQADFDDVRFVNANCNGGGISLIFELDSKTDSTYAGFWVKGNLSTGVNQYSMYYDNPSVNSTSNPVDTFTYGGSILYRSLFHFDSNDTVYNSINGSDNWTITGSLWESYDCPFGRCFNSSDTLFNYTANPNGEWNNVNAPNGSISGWSKDHDDHNKTTRLGGRGQTALTTQWLFHGNSTYGQLLINVITATNESSISPTFLDGWNFLVITWNTSTTILYVNGVRVIDAAEPGPPVGGVGGDFLFRTYHTYANGNHENMSLDEVRFDKITLSEDEIERMFQNANFSNFVFGSEIINLFPVVLLNSPVEYFNSTSNTIIFNGTVWDDFNLFNVTLYGNWGDGWHGNETNSSGINNTDYIFNKSLIDGIYVWNYYACDNESRCSFDISNRTLSVGFVLDFNVTLTVNTSFEFFPDNSTHQGVEPVNQTGSIGVFTVHNNLTEDIQIGAKLNVTNNNITLKIGNSSIYSDSVSITESYKLIQANLTSDSTIYFWAWADYNNPLQPWYPEIEIKAGFL